MPRIRVQPLDIEVPEQNPFANDLLDRREAVVTLTNIVRNIDGPCILSIDAPWGAGKTTFLNMWGKYLRTEGFVVVRFNAWENDFLEEPFVALSTEIIEALRSTGVIESGWKAPLAAEATQVVMQALPTILGSLASNVPLVGSTSETVVKNLAERALSSHIESQHAIQAFKVRLGQLACELANHYDGLPLIVMIDELDRCRPSYAIELLETAKHIFSVDSVIFALSTNRQQLEASIKGIYGDSFSATDYLERFFDISFRLPSVDRRTYIEETLRSVGIYQTLESQPLCKQAFVRLLDASQLSPRELARAIHYLSLVFASMDTSDRNQVGIAAMLMAYKAISYSSYQRYINGALTDGQALQGAIANFPTENQAIENTDEYATFRTIVMACNQLKRGERVDGETLVYGVLNSTEGTSMYDGELRQRLEAYVGYLVANLDFDGLVCKVELVSEDHPSGS